MNLSASLAACAALAVAAPAERGGATPSGGLDAVGRGYVRLALAIGEHRPDYVDAYYGPEELAAEAKAAGKRPLAELLAEAARLDRAAAAAKAPLARDRRRREYLREHLAAARAFLRTLGGERLSFDAEAKAYFGAAPPRRPLARYEDLAARVAHLLPGDGPLAERWARYRERFVVPKDRIEAVVRAAEEEARRRTVAHVALPAGERFTLELVTGKPWGGYNWYQGGYASRIQVNTDLPFYVDRVVDIAAHEGYPGHHLFNVLHEERLARGRGWIEFTVIPLFAPVSLLAEGTGELGIEMAFPGAERTAFEREVIFPLAGLDPGEAERYAEIRGLLRALRGADVAVGRAYLDGKASRGETEAWLVRHALATPEQARKKVDFLDTYRSYVVNYGFGEELAAATVGRAGKDPARRWAAFLRLVSEPVLARDLRSR